MSFKLTFLKTKCFQKIVENRKTRYPSFSSMFLRGLFYGLKLIFQTSDNIGLCTSWCIIIIVVNDQNKSMKKITQGNCLYIYSPARNRTGSNNFLGWVSLEKQLKVNKRGLRDCNKPWEVKCKHAIFCLQRSAYWQYISSSCGKQNGGWRREQN